ncbi:MAG: glycosyl hydrolase-related protein [Gemmatimonadaceae bacterium]
MPTLPERSLIVHVVSHTHWDREWYHSAGRFRQRLVALIDALLDDDTDVAPFLLDGQTIVLDDYLEVRPERRAQLSARLREGSLEAGPWYVLADELIPTGESLVRNLLTGRAALHALGATAPPVLYSPDAFGHPAMLPALAAGFGLSLVVLWRGYGGAQHPRGDVVRWLAPDGSSALVYHLSPSGYELGSALPADDAEACGRWDALRDLLAPRATVGHVLIPNGADHHARQLDRADAVRALATVAQPHEVRLTSLGDFARALVRAADASPSIPQVTGELRDSYGYTWTLQGTFASRSSLKRRAARAERALLRNTEPWVALAERARVSSRPALMRSAWKTLLQCQPHDTICGCSIDAVARAMACRLEDVELQAAGLREEALFDLIGHDIVASRADPARWPSSLVICNPSVYERGGVAEVEVLVVRDHVCVGPGSGSATAMPIAALSASWTVDGGRFVQRLAGKRRHERLESPHHYPWNDFVETTRVLLQVPPVGGYGTRTFAMTAGDLPERGMSGDAVVCEGKSMRNGTVDVEADVRGIVHLSTTDGMRTIASLLSIESVTDAGDLYTASLRGEPRFAEFSNPRLDLRGPLRATLVIQWRVEFYDRLRMLAPRVATGTVTLTLDADTSFVRIDVEGNNGIADQRLRLRVATDVVGGAVVADAAFGPVRREPIMAPTDTSETPPPTAPLARYITLASRDRGATIYSDGLGEYETLADGTVALTLLRAVGELSRNDLPERPGHAGWPASTPDAQEPGPFSGRFAILLHGARDEATVARIERIADDVLHPLFGRTIRSAGALPETTTGVSLRGSGLALSAIKPSEDGAWMVLRCINLTDREVPGSWMLGTPAREARSSRLDETPKEIVGIQDNSIAFVAPPRSIVTMLVR